MPHQIYFGSWSLQCPPLEKPELKFVMCVCECEDNTDRRTMAQGHIPLLRYVANQTKQCSKTQTVWPVVALMTQMYVGLPVHHHQNVMENVELFPEHGSYWRAGLNNEDWYSSFLERTGRLRVEESSLLVYVNLYYGNATCLIVSGNMNEFFI